MNTLKAKILGLITIIVIVIVTVAALINIQLQKQITSITKQNAHMMSETVKQSILNAMHSGRPEQVQNILAGIKSQESIKVLRIYDTSGRIIASADRGEIGNMVGKDELPMMLSGAFAHQDLPLDDKNRFDTITLFNNGSECNGCHDASKEVLGVLEVDIGADHLRSFFTGVRDLSFISAALIILLITITISIFLIY
jgi:hypothetical protein